MWFIYSLTDPRDGRVRYVGKTNNVKVRLRNHVRDALRCQSRNHRLNWIRYLVEGGQMPQLCILESGEGDWQAAEKKWIAQFRQAGYELVNATDGGGGMDGYQHSAEVRAKISTAHKAIADKTSARMKGSKHSAETRAKISAATKGRIRSAETCARLSAAAKNRSAKTRAKMRATLSVRWKEHRAEMMGNLSKRPRPSDESRARIKEAMASPEIRAKMSTAAKARSANTSSWMKAVWATRKARSQQCVSAS